MLNGASVACSSEGNSRENTRLEERGITMCSTIELPWGMVIDTIGELKAFLGDEALVYEEGYTKKIFDKSCLCPVNIEATLAKTNYVVSCGVFGNWSVRDKPNPKTVERIQKIYDAINADKKAKENAPDMPI